MTLATFLYNSVPYRCSSFRPLWPLLLTLEAPWAGPTFPTATSPEWMNSNDPASLRHWRRFREPSLRPRRISRLCAFENMRPGLVPLASIESSTSSIDVTNPALVWSLALTPAEVQARRGARSSNLRVSRSEKVMVRVPTWIPSSHLQQTVYYVLITFDTYIFTLLVCSQISYLPTIDGLHQKCKRCNARILRINKSIEFLYYWYKKGYLILKSRKCAMLRWNNV